MGTPVLLVSGASLPRFIALESLSGSAGVYLTVGNVPYLTFTAEQKTRMVAHEVVYNADEAGALMLRAPNGRFWQRNSMGYILADRESTPGTPASDPACYFRAFRYDDDDRLFLQSSLDGEYIKRYSNLVNDALHASATGTGDIYAAFRYTSAVDDAVILPRYITLKGDNQMYYYYYHYYCYYYYCLLFLLSNSKHRNVLCNARPPYLTMYHQ